MLLPSASGSNVNTLEPRIERNESQSKEHSFICQNPLSNIAQHKLLNLTTASQGYLAIAVFTKPKNMDWRLVPSEHLPYPLLDVFESRLFRTFFVHKKGSRYLHVAWVGYADHDGTSNRWMLDQTLFNLERVYVLTTYSLISRCCLNCIALNPPRMMMSLNRPVMVQYPSTSRTASSPVCSHVSPCSSLMSSSAVFSGFSQ